MRKHVLIVGNTYNVANVVARQVKEVIGDLFDVMTSDVNDARKFVANVDAVIISTPSIFDVVRKRVTSSTETFILERTLSKDGFEKLLTLPVDKKIYVVNATLIDEIETVELLYQLGAKQYDFLPYSRGINIDFENDIIVTPNEMEYVSKDAKNVVNIGDRKMDAMVLLNMLSKLNIMTPDTAIKVIDYMNGTVPKIPVLKEYFRIIAESGSLYKSVLNDLDEGILIVKNSIIEYMNPNVKKILGDEGVVFVGKSIDMVFSEEELRTTVEIVKKIGKENCAIHFKLTEENGFTGFIRFVTESLVHDEMLYLESHRSKNAKGTRYTFDDIMSKSENMKKTIMLAKTFARSDVPVLIEGESGTGKELLAQSIHSESTRKDKSFVAFNCAAINDNLVESELFGYEAGSFTGADSKGKIGIMEYAHGGTLFLDEIEDLSIEAQAKILRVLQEKEIMRVGSVKPIPVDIRIIVATNRSLRDMVNLGEFRRDLYYRLDVLRLALPPLRERREDITELILRFLDEKKCKVMMDKDIMSVVNRYDWPGNVRELDNFVNYYANIYQANIGILDKKKYVLEYFDRKGISDNSVVLKNEEGLQDDLEREILRIIEEKSDLYHGAGRGVIRGELLKKGYDTSEGTVKRILSDLSRKELVAAGRGRAGSRITVKGKEYLAGSDG